MVCLWRGSREAVEDANGGRHSHLGKGAQRALRQAVRRSCAVAWSGTGRGIGGHTCAESGHAPATIFSLSLPPCFPGFAEPGREARNGPGGPSEAIDSIDEICSGRRDSNPRPQPWQGCACARCIGQNRGSPFSSSLLTQRHEKDAACDRNDWRSVRNRACMDLPNTAEALRKTLALKIVPIRGLRQ